MSSSPSEIKPLSTSILRAGAGAGKTTTLIRLFEDVAFNFKKQHKRFPRMVLTTFTRKATQELRERLLSEALKKEQPDMFRYINQRSRVHISTIHGVLSLYLMQFGKELGLAPEFKVLEGPEIYFREKRILKNLLLENPDWLELVEVYDISVLLDMLGSYYQHHFLHDSLAPVSLETLQSLAQKTVTEICKKGYDFYKTISSHELSEGWRNYISLFALLKDTSAYDVDKLADFFSKLGRKPPFGKKNPPFDESLHEDFAAFVKDSKDTLDEEGLKTENLQRHQHLSQKFETLAKAFCEKSLKERLQTSILSMTDLEGLSLKLIKQFPWSAKKFSNQWDFWMIDEYQDTSPLQVELLKHLVGDAPHFVVGDPQQSIYLFRGARSDVFHAKLKEIENQKGEVKTALINYRSQAPVLEFINSYFANKSAFSSMTPHRQEGLGEVCAEAVIVTKTEEDEELETKAIISLIQEKLKAGVPAQEICVLSRTNRILEDIAKMAFKLHLPVQLHSAGGFSTRREILDFASILKFLINPHDDLNLLSLLRSPWFPMPDAEIAKLTENRDRKSSLWNYWQKSKSNHETKLIEQLKFYKDMAESIGLSETLSRVLTDRGLIDVSQHLDPSGRREANLWKFLLDFKIKESTPGFNPIQFIDDLQAAADGQDEGDATPVIEPDRVNLMTVHASKGLQFSHVIIVGFGNDSRKFYGDWWMMDEDTGQWTLSLKSADQKKTLSLWGIGLVEERQKREAEEADRVLYVAMTRAKNFISFIWPLGPRKGSWASQFPFSTVEGIHKYDKFSLRIRMQMPEPETYSSQATTAQQCRPVYKEITLQAPPERETPTPDGLKHLLERTRRSSELHGLFESMKFQPSLWQSPPQEFSEVISYLQNLKEIPFKDLLEGGHIDWNFKLKEKDLHLNGHVDLWAVHNKQAWLFQYKLGSIKETAKVFEQLETSAWALKKMNRLEETQNINLVLLSPSEKDFRLKTIDSSTLQGPEM